MKVLPGYLRKYFWEVDFGRLDLNNFREYILERLMEYGDARAVRWLIKHFTPAEIKKVLTHTRGLSPHSANFWRLLVGVKPERVLCLQKSSLAIRKRFWRV